MRRHIVLTALFSVTASIALGQQVVAWVAPTAEEIMMFSRRQEARMKLIESHQKETKAALEEEVEKDKSIISSLKDFITKEDSDPDEEAALQKKISYRRLLDQQGQVLKSDLDNLKGYEVSCEKDNELRTKEDEGAYEAYVYPPASPTEPSPKPTYADVTTLGVPSKATDDFDLTPFSEALSCLGKKCPATVKVEQHNTPPTSPSRITPHEAK